MPFRGILQLFIHLDLDLGLIFVILIGVNKKGNAKSSQYTTL